MVPWRLGVILTQVNRIYMGFIEGYNTGFR